MQYRLNEQKVWELIDHWLKDDETYHFSAEEAIEIANSIEKYI